MSEINKLFIHSFSVQLFQHRVEGPAVFPMELWAEGRGQLIHTLRQFRDASQHIKHIFGLWEETRVPEGNPLKDGDNMQTLHHRVEAGIKPTTKKVCGKHDNH